MTKSRRLVLVIAFSALAGLVTWALVPPSEQPFFDYLAERRAAGEPTTFEEFAGPMTAESENAAPQIDAAWADFVKERGPRSAWPRSVQAEADACGGCISEPTPDERTALAVFADGLDSFTARVASALDRPQFKYPVRVQPNGLLDLTHVERLRCVVFLLSVRARFARSAETRLEGCRILAKFASRLDGTSCDEVTVGMWALAGCVTALREGAHAAGWDASAARRAIDEPLRRAGLPQISGLFRCSAVGHACTYSALLDGRVPSDSARMGVALSAWGNVQRLGERFSGQRVSRVYEPGHAREFVAECRLGRAAADLPTSSLVRFRDEYHALVKEAGLNARVEPHQWCDYSSELAASDVRGRLARIALALVEFRAAHGDFPSSLDELRAALPDGVPIDPFADAPFVYERTSVGVRLSSRSTLAPQAPATFDEAAKYVMAWELNR